MISCSLQSGISSVLRRVQRLDCRFPNSAKMRTLFVVLLVVVAGAMGSRDLRSCGSCGMECENACGTRNFKTCCFNYMRKRGDLSAGLPLAMDPSLRLELWLARSRSPFYQRILQKAAMEQNVYEPQPQLQAQQ